MATTTPNFSWPVPTSTDLVKDGATAIEALGDSIDASLVDLKGGTSGQVLAKNSNTDMDFVWVTDAAGDITGVTAGTGISGGGTSGTVTVTNSMATAIDAKGDLVPGTGADTFARLAVGANGTVLTADSAEATGLKWAAASSGAIVYISQATISAGTSVTLDSVFTSTYRNYLLYFDYTTGVSGGSDIRVTFRAGGVDDTTAVYYSNLLYGAAGSAGSSLSSGQTNAKIGGGGGTYGGLVAATIYAPQATAQKRIESRGHKDVGANAETHVYNAGFVGTTAFDGIKLTTATSTITGTFRIYGIVNS